MSKLDEKVAKYCDAYKAKVGNDLDEDLMRKVTRGLGPSIYSRDAETLSMEKSEMERVANNYVAKKLGVQDDMDARMGAVEACMEKYGRSERAKYRAVIYYMLCKHYGKEEIYG